MLCILGYPSIPLTSSLLKSIVDHILFFMGLWLNHICGMIELWRDGCLKYYSLLKMFLFLDFFFEHLQEMTLILLIVSSYLRQWMVENGEDWKWVNSFAQACEFKSWDQGLRIMMRWKVTVMCCRMFSVLDCAGQSLWLCSAILGLYEVKLCGENKHPTQWGQLELRNSLNSLSVKLKLVAPYDLQV